MKKLTNIAIICTIVITMLIFGAILLAYDNDSDWENQSGVQELGYTTRIAGESKECGEMRGYDYKVATFEVTGGGAVGRIGLNWKRRV